MAKVPLQDVPDVQVLSTPPSDYQSIPSSPADFGGLIGQGEKEFSGDLARSGQDFAQTALMKQQRFNVTAGDDAMNQFMEKGDHLTYGVPGDPNQRGLYSLKGAEALRNGPEVITSLQTLREEIKQGLANDAQRLAFDEQSRRYFQIKSGEISRHLSSQADVYESHVNQAKIKLAANGAAFGYNSDDTIMHSLADAQNTAEAEAIRASGAKPDDAILEIAKRGARTQVVQDAVDAALLANDPLRARTIVEKFGSLIDPIVGKRLGDQTKNAANQAAVGDAVRGVMSGPRTSGAEATPEEHQKNVNRAIQNAPAAKIVHDGLVQRGMDSDAAWAFAGNGVQESSLDPKNIGDNGFARGLFMWRTDADSGARAQDFKQIYGHLPNEGTLDEQLDFVMHELKGKESGAWQAIQNAQGIDNKARLVSTAYLRPKDTEQEEPRRATIATTLASLNGGGGGGAGPVNMPPSASHNPEPFGWEQQRMDAARQEARARFPNDPKLQKQVIDGVWEEIQRTNLLQEKYDRKTKEARQAAQNQIMGDLVTAMHKDPANFDPSILDAKDQAGNYVLEYKERESAYAYLKTQLHEHGIDDTAPLGKGYVQAYNAILDGKLTETSDLLRRGLPGGDLSAAGIQKLHTMMLLTKKDMNIHGMAELERGMINYATGKLLFPDAVESSIALPHALRDPQGEAVRNSRFLPAFYFGLDEAIKSGKPERVHDFLTKENMDKLLQGLRSPEEIARARLSATGESAPGDKDKPGAPLPPPPPDPRERVKNFPLTNAPGMIASGNIDPWNRPVLKNPDGSYSTTSSISIGTDKGETLIPTVVNGVRLSNEAAIQHYAKTGENLGTFRNADFADQYATRLHNAQATLYDSEGTPLRPVNPKAWTDLMSGEMPVASNGQPLTHKAWASALGMLLQNPTEQNQQWFNQWAGPRGYDAATILKQLRGELPTASPGGQAAPATPAQQTTAPQPAARFAEPTPREWANPNMRHFQRGERPPAGQHLSDWLAERRKAAEELGETVGQDPNAYPPVKLHPDNVTRPSYRRERGPRRNEGVRDDIQH